MIGSVTRGASFHGLARYLTENQDRVAWTSQRNLMPGLTPKQMATAMDATARQSAAERPVYHLSLSLAPEEGLTPKQWNEAADRMLSALGLEEHQALIVAHSDRDHEHIHIAVSRVHPARYRAAPLRHDYRTVEQACRHLERDWGLRETPGHHYQLPGQQRPAQGGLTRGEHHSARGPWLEAVREAVRPHLHKASDWTDFLERLSRHGLTVQARGRGMVITDGDRSVSASRVDRSASRNRLEERWGSFRAWRRDVHRLCWLLDRYADRDDRWRDLAGEAKRHHQVIRRAEAMDRGVARAEEAYSQALAALYVQPESARNQIAAAVRAHDLAEITTWVLRRPEVYGETLDIPHPGTQTYVQHELVDKHRRWALLRRDRDAHLPQAKAARERLAEIGGEVRQAQDRARAMRQLARIGKRLTRYGGRRLISLLKSQIASSLLPPHLRLPVSLARRAIRMARGRQQDLTR